jgi:hypothetical protein
MNGPEMMIPLIFIIASAATFISLFSGRHKERMAMIEKGLTSDEIRAMYTRDVKNYHPLASLKWGLVLTLSGVALTIGQYLHQAYSIEDGVVVGLVCLFAGVGLVAFYLIASRRKQE